MLLGVNVSKLMLLRTDKSLHEYTKLGCYSAVQNVTSFRCMVGETLCELLVSVNCLSLVF